MKEISNILCWVIGHPDVILTSIITGIITYFASVRSLKRQFFNEAVSKFRSAFVETERAIDERYQIKGAYVRGEFVYELVLPLLAEQEKAIIEFSHLLNRKNRLDFKKAWMKYAYPNLNDGLDDPQLDYKSIHVDEQMNIRKKLRERLDKVFLYARYK